MNTSDLARAPSPRCTPVQQVSKQPASRPSNEDRDQLPLLHHQLSSGPSTFLLSRPLARPLLTKVLAAFAIGDTTVCCRILFYP